MGNNSQGQRLFNFYFCLLQQLLLLILLYKLKPTKFFTAVSLFTFFGTIVKKQKATLAADSDKSRGRE